MASLSLSPPPPRFPVGNGAFAEMPSYDAPGDSRVDNIDTVMRAISDMHMELRELRHEVQIISAGTPRRTDAKPYLGFIAPSTISNGAPPDHKDDKNDTDGESVRPRKTGGNIAIGMQELRRMSHEEKIPDPIPNKFSVMVESAVFRSIISALIVLNSIFVGIEVDMDMNRALVGKELSSEIFDWMNHTFTFLFVIEVFLRVLAYRKHFVIGEDRVWNIFDFLVLLCELGEYVYSGVNGLSAFRSFRAFRFVRTLRVLRIIRVFRRLELLVQIFMESLSSLLWMLALMTLVFYLATIIFVVGSVGYLQDDESSQTNASMKVETAWRVASDDLTYEQMNQALGWHFGSVSRGMLSLFMAVSGGIDYYELVQPLMNISVIHVLVFAAFVMVIVFGIFNALNACFVEAVIHNRDKDLLIYAEQARTKQFIKDLAELFREGTKNNNPLMTKEELAKHCTDPRISAYLAFHSLNTSDVNTLFELLDTNLDEYVDVEEFVSGILKLKGPARCLDLIRMQDSIDDVKSQIGEFSCLIAKPMAERSTV